MQVLAPAIRRPLNQESLAPMVERRITTPNSPLLQTVREKEMAAVFIERDIPIYHHVPFLQREKTNKKKPQFFQPDLTTGLVTLEGEIVVFDIHCFKLLDACGPNPKVEPKEIRKRRECKEFWKGEIHFALVGSYFPEELNKKLKISYTVLASTYMRVVQYEERPEETRRMFEKSLDAFIEEKCEEVNPRRLIACLRKSEEINNKLGIITTDLPKHVENDGAGRKLHVPDGEVKPILWSESNLF